VENVITALKLASRIKYQQRHLSAQLQNTIWKQVYYHDLNTYKDAHSANYSDISRRSILQGTLVFRILHSVHKNKIEIDEMIAPSNIKLNKDELEAKTIESDGFNTFISQISLLATDNSSITLQEMKMTIQL
jgi:hypothetical protein